MSERRRLRPAPPDHVEDANAADQLQHLGVDFLQGYWFARPMPDAELIPWLTRAGSTANTL